MSEALPPSCDCVLSALLDPIGHFPRPEAGLHLAEGEALLQQRNPAAGLGAGRARDRAGEPPIAVRRDLTQRARTVVGLAHGRLGELPSSSSARISRERASLRTSSGPA
jgi:hypothetical protein